MFIHAKKSLAFALMGLVVLSSFAPSAPARAGEDQTPKDDSTVACTQYTLLWTNPDAVQYPGAELGEPVPPGTEGVASNPVDVADGKAPAVPDALNGQADWQCTKASGTTDGLKVDQNSTEGNELCERAVELSARFGTLTALDHLQQNVHEAILTEIQDQINSFTGWNITLNMQDLKKKLLGEGAKFLTDQFNELFGDPIKDAVKEEANKIINTGKKELQKLAEKYVGDLAKKVVGKAAEISLVNPVPTEESGALLESSRVIEQRTADIIMEQRRQEIIANRRQHCQALYTKVNEQLKKSLLFNLSNQIVDWVQSGKQPQFIKQPGKFLGDTALLAVNRTISQIAPRLCAPFRNQVLLQIPGYSKQTNPFYQPVTCTIDQVVDNIENFYNDFKNGGWLAYSEIWQPQNNYFGASLLANELAASQASQAVQEAKSDLDRGNGFVSQYECTNWVLYSPKEPGTVTQSIMNALILVGDTYYAPDYSHVEGATEDGEAPPIPPGVPNDSHWVCTNKAYTTPGSVASGLAKQAAETTIANINQTSDVEALLRTLEDAILNKLVKSGVGGLKKILNGLPDINL